MLRLFWPAGFRRGDLVEVRSAIEIAATLDADGRLDGMPFMPEMVPYCGQRVRVYRRADKTCVEGFGLRRLRNTVFLENLRCDGAVHDGCERGCLMFWKEAWLRPVADQAADEASAPAHGATAAAIGWAANLPTRSGGRYICQSTALAAATSKLSGWNPMHLLREVATGEVTLQHFAQIVTRGLHNKARKLVRLPEIGGLAGVSRRNPKGDLALAPNEIVDIKSTAEISTTLDPTGRNQGLTFEPDMADYTQQRHQVEKPVTRIILEQTGEMIRLSSTVILKGVTCRGLCSKNCPRNNPLFWREIWLRRVEAETPTAANLPAASCARQKENAHA